MHLPGEQGGKAKPGGLVSPWGEQGQHGHLRGPEMGTETPPRARPPRLPDYFVSLRLCPSASNRAGPAPPRRRRETRKVRERRPC